jgi:glycine cleavage system aminomethyltransferase T
MAVAQVDVLPGKSVYTSLLNPQGGIRADLTIIRRGLNAYRVITGSMDGGRDRKWLLDNMPVDGSVHLDDRTSALCGIGLWGPKSRQLLQSVTRDDVSNAGFPYGTARDITIGSVKVWAFRISYVGELGWELHFSMEHGIQVWDILREAGAPLGFIPAGIGVYGTTGRIEKCYRLYGPELANDYNLVETGMARPKVKPQDFIGKKAYLKFREEPPAALLCTLTVDDHCSKSGEKRFMLGREPILTPEEKSIVDRKDRRSFATSAGSCPSVQKHALMAYLPPEYAQLGKKLKVEYFGEPYPVSVATVGATALFDPNNERMKA